MSRKGYCDAESFKRLGAIFLVIRRAASDSLGSDRLGFLVGRTLVVKRLLSRAVTCRLGIGGQLLRLAEQAAAATVLGAFALVMGHRPSFAY